MGELLIIWWGVLLIVPVVQLAKLVCKLLRWTGLLKGKPKNPRVRQRPVSTEKILNDYGAFLANSPLTGLCIIDAQNLPWPKDQIKLALFTGLVNASDAKVRDLMVAGLIYLTFYQAGVGRSPVGFDPPKFTHITDALEAAKAMGPDLKAAEEWESIVQAERQGIVTALKARGIAINL